MKTIKPKDVLVYYDGVEVFTGEDSNGGYYIGMAIDTVGDFDRYLVARVTPESLGRFRCGDLDLRTILLEAPGGEWYITLADGEYGQPLVLEPQDCPLEETDFLPEAGFLLDEATDDELEGSA